jgi:hypothetical protein
VKFVVFEKELKELVASTKNLNALQKLFMTDEGRSKMIGDILIGLMVPAVRKVQDAWDRSAQAERNLHLAFALAAYKSEEGKYPPKLDVLAPKYLPKIPGDLYTGQPGQPLIYRPAGEGYLLYSVGANGLDERGHWLDDDPRGDDPRVRMPLPAPNEKK